jgi:HlyD family secretion protein
MTIADMSQINVEVKVDETEIDKVAVGQKAKIKVDAFGDAELEGEVLQKTPLAVGKSQTSGGLSVNINVQEAKEFRVVIRLNNLTPEMQTGLRPGMSERGYRSSASGGCREKARRLSVARHSGSGRNSG